MLLIILILDEFDKILSYYISHHNKNFDIDFFKCDFQIEFDNNFFSAYRDRLPL